MSAAPLKKLTIEHLRGSVKPFSIPFEKGKKLAVVYGENGTGKSTICDALDFLGKGKVGSLDSRGLGAGVAKYWPSMGRQPSDVAVTLETATSSVRAAIIKNEVVVDRPADRPKIEVLRRGQILSLVEAKPAERYSAISRFIDVSGVEAAENSLRQSIKDQKTLNDTTAAKIHENDEMIAGFWEAANKPGKSHLEWAKAEVTRDATASEEEIRALDKMSSAYEGLRAFPGRLETALNAIETAEKAEADVKKEADACVDSIASEAKEVLEVLTAARSYLLKDVNPTVCPLCESSEKVEGLADRISERLKSFSTLQAVQTKKQQSSGNVQRAKDALERLKTEAAEAAKKFQEARESYQWSQDINLPKDPAPQDITALSEWLSATALIPDNWKAARSARQDDKKFLTTLKGALKTYNENVRGQKDLAARIPKLERALAIMEEERRQFTDDVLGKIAGEVGRIYEAVHPGEGLNKISLELDAKKRASLEIGASFNGQEGTPPQAYFSESHLDTLGLCVFLALAALDGPEDTILVLDDVLASVDEPHVERLIEMLYAEAIKFRHCVITTHYRPWKQKLRWGWLKIGQCQFIELAKWSNDSGMKLIRSVPDVQSLRNSLEEENPDPQQVCAKAGVILEAALDFITQLYQCSIPRRLNNLYTLGDLLPAVKGKLRAALRVEVLTGKDADGKNVYSNVNLGPILDQLEKISQARNVFGCHFNRLSFDLLESDALEFGRQVLLLAEALMDPEAGWPRSDKSGCYWSTSGETRILHPLQQPK